MQWVLGYLIFNYTIPKCKQAKNYVCSKIWRRAHCLPFTLCRIAIAHTSARTCSSTQVISFKYQNCFSLSVCLFFQASCNVVVIFVVVVLVGTRGEGGAICPPLKMVVHPPLILEIFTSPHPLHSEFTYILLSA